MQLEPNFNGSYAVIVSQNGCVDTSVCITISDLHIIENDFGSQLKVFPNPTDGEIHMDLGDVYTEVKVSLYDSKGKLLGVKTEFNTSLLELNIDRAKGQYLLKLKSLLVKGQRLGFLNNNFVPDLNRITIIRKLRNYSHFQFTIRFYNLRCIRD